jgi:uncharacterized SAM-binding protein YcdF (DUF218 family)
VKKQAKRTFGKALFMLIKLGILLFVVAYALCIVYQLWHEHHLPAPDPNSTAPVVVLGAQIDKNGQPMLQLQWRLEKALEAYQQYPRPIVVCGAQGADEPRTEASAMKEWLVQHGVLEEHVLVDDLSFNTKQNIKHALQMLPENTRRITLVTSDYHMPRALQIAKDAGVSADALASSILPKYWLKNHAREGLAWGKYFLGKVFPFLN